MSSFGGGDPRVNTVFTADATNAAKGAKDAERAVVDSAKKQEEAVKQSWGKQVGAVTEFIGKITAAIGVATGFYAIGSKIRDVWEQIANASERAAQGAEKFQQTIDYSNAIKSVEQLDAEIAKLSSELDSYQEDWVHQGYWQQAKQKELNEKLAVLMKDRDVAMAKRDADAAKAEQSAADAKAAAEEKAGREYLADQQRLHKEAAAQEADANKESLDRTAQYLDDAQSLRVAGIDDDGEQAIAQFEQDAAKRRMQLQVATTQAEVDAINALRTEAEKRLQAQLSGIRAEAEKEREEDTKRSVARQIELYEALQGAIEGASQAQQSFTQNQFGGMVSDIKKIAQLLEVRGGWKK